MSPESDGAIDRRGLLSALTGERAAAPSSPVVVSSPMQRAAPAIPNRWFQHRAEVSAIVTGFVGILWGAVGLGLGAWLPCLVGALWGAAALSIWSIEVWGAD